MSGVTPMLKAKSIAETIEFYTKKLGFEVENRREGWCCLRWGGATVMFYDIEAHQGPPMMTGVLYFNPKDIKALWEELKDKSKVEWELQPMAYGMLEFAIRDCNGYILSFGQEMESKP